MEKREVSCKWCGAEIAQRPGPGRPVTLHQRCREVAAAVAILDNVCMAAGAVESVEAEARASCAARERDAAADQAAGRILANRQQTIGVLCEPCHVLGVEREPYVFRNGRALCSEHADAFGADASEPPPPVTVTRPRRPAVPWIKYMCGNSTCFRVAEFQGQPFGTCGACGADTWRELVDTAPREPWPCPNCKGETHVIIRPREDGRGGHHWRVCTHGCCEDAWNGPASDSPYGREILARAKAPGAGLRAAIAAGELVAAEEPPPDFVPPADDGIPF